MRIFGAIYSVQVRAALLTVTQVTRNASNMNTWHHLRASLTEAHSVMRAVGEKAETQQIINDAIARGDRLVYTLTPSMGAGAPGAVLKMFTALLRKAHGVINELHSADLVQVRQLSGIPSGSSGIGNALAMGPTPTFMGQAVTHPFPQVAVGSGALGFGAQPFGMMQQPPPMAAGLGTAPRAPRPSRRQPRVQMTPAAAQPTGPGAGAGYYTPGPAGRAGGGRGRVAGQGVAGTPPAGMSQSHYTMMKQVRDARNVALQQQQLANPGVPTGGEMCRKCQASNRDPYHSHLTCAFWICRRCKEGGHRVNACQNQWAPP